VLARPAPGDGAAPAGRGPEASVVVRLEGGADRATACILALIEETRGDAEYEALVVDDGADRRTRSFLRSLGGQVRVARHDVPEGMAACAAWAADAAQAPVLVMLDEDTVVRRGWLRPLLDRLASDPSLGAVGPRVLRPDGRLHAAGGVLGLDGRPLLPGHGHPCPEMWPVRADEEPDFLDGSCIAVRREAFRGSGGFDPALPEGAARAADLCRSIVSAGWRLACEPRSTVESRSAPDLESGRGLFVRKWGIPKGRWRPMAIAFYLPQFHPVPENDRWWGRGFTDWSNVVRGAPLFDGHEQPHLPADLGFYDLRLAESRQAQADLAAQHGIDAFCYYHYWFEGRRLLGRPLDEVLRTKDPELPFCLCWANEDWRANWDGRTGEVLVQQRYSESDDLDHIRWLLQVFRDERYLRVDGKPLMLVYRALDLPDPVRTTELWRREARREGVGELMLCRVNSFDDDHGDPRPLGFDAAVEFQPDWSVLWRLPARADTRPHSVVDYATVVKAMLAKPEPPWRRFPCVTPRWDNSPRKPDASYVLEGSTPELYGAWLSTLVEREMARGATDQLVFVNAWNEWGEGAHLEPCTSWGRAYLEAHRDAMRAPVAGLPVEARG
jgi:hypothetical protein